MVTIDQEKALKYILHHGRAFAVSNVENLIFCSPKMRSVLEKQAALLGGTYRFFSDNTPSGPDRKRNKLLQSSQGRFCIFLDDDSLFCSPEESLQYILQTLHLSSNKWFLLTAVYIDNVGYKLAVKPKLFSVLGPGSGIEWNQIFERDLLLAAGGWKEGFSIGSRWRSGSAMILMINLWRRGHTAFCLPQIKVSHPAQIDETDFSTINKIRRYRYAIGAIVVEEWKSLGVFGVAVIIIRCIFLAPIAGLFDQVRGKRVKGTIRLYSPVDFIKGVFDRILYNEYS